MDFSQVKRVIIDKKEVATIFDSHTNTLWQKSPPGWHTVWEGTKKIGSTYIDPKAQETKFLFGTVPYSDRIRLRVYFLADHNAGDKRFNTYLTTTHTEGIRMYLSEFIPADPSGDTNDPPNQDQSPVSYDNSAFDSTETTLAKASMKAVIGATATDYNMSCEAVLQYNKDTGEIYGEYHKSHSQSKMKLAAIMTIIKIEVYY